MCVRGGAWKGRSQLALILDLDDLLETSGRVRDVELQKGGRGYGQARRSMAHTRRVSRPQLPHLSNRTGGFSPRLRKLFSSIKPPPLPNPPLPPYPCFLMAVFVHAALLRHHLCRSMASSHWHACMPTVCEWKPAPWAQHLHLLHSRQHECHAWLGDMALHTARALHSRLLVMTLDDIATTVAISRVRESPFLPLLFDLLSADLLPWEEPCSWPVEQPSLGCSALRLLACRGLDPYQPSCAVKTPPAAPLPRHLRQKALHRTFMLALVQTGMMELESDGIGMRFLKITRSQTYARERLPQPHRQEQGSFIAPSRARVLGPLTAPAPPVACGPPAPALPPLLLCRAPPRPGSRLPNLARPPPSRRTQGPPVLLRLPGHRTEVVGQGQGGGGGRAPPCRRRRGGQP